MKLYTEEDLKKVVSIYSEEYETTTDEILSELKLTPIELPNNDDIEKFIQEQNIVGDEMIGVYIGTKWYREQLKKKK